MKTAAFIIAFGPEARLFLHSGLIDTIDKKLHTVIFTFNPQSRIFIDAGKSDNVLQMPVTEEKPILQRIRWYANQSTVFSRSRRDGVQQWRQHISLPGGAPNPKRETLKSLVLSSPMVQSLLKKAEDYLGRIYGAEQEWQKYFRQTDTSLAIVSSYSSRTLPPLQTARNMGIKTCLIFNSWKDLYTRPHLPDLFDVLVVWNEQMKRKLIRYNPHIKEKMVRKAFPLHFSYLCKKPLWSETDFRETIGADKARPLLVYTAASPLAVSHEEAIVRDIVEAVRDFPDKKRPQIIVRMNPMEIHSPRFAVLRKSFPEDIILNAPRWEWDPEHDWCSAGKEDLDLMNALVHYADLHVSLPSTMTFEFALADKPMINIAYDPVPPRHAAMSVRRFWEGDFYREIRQSGAVQASDSFDALRTHIARYLMNPSVHSEQRKHLVSSMLGWSNGDPLSEMASVITNIG